MPGLSARRLAGIGLLALLAWGIVAFPARLAPEWERASLATHVRAEPIAGARLSRRGPFRLAGAWQLSAAAPEFHSLSGLALSATGAFVAVTDRGMVVSMPRPGEDAEAKIDALVPDKDGIARVVDAEAVALGPGGRKWFALENQNAIVRTGPGTARQVNVRPPEMTRWPVTRGPESLTRLADGRFVVLGEGREKGRDGTFPGLVFDRDPDAGGTPFLFHLAMPDGLRPVDVAQLPDGNLLVLGRAFHFPFRFESALYVVNLADIGPARQVAARLAAWIGGAGISDNMEGLAVEEAPDGRVTAWVVSDDNQAQWLQQTILLKLETETGALRPEAGSAR